MSLSGFPLPAGVAQDPPATLRERLGELVVSGRLDEAVALAQSALKESPSDPAVRSEYIDLHLSIGHLWLREGKILDVATAADAVLALAPANAAALRLRAEVERRVAEVAELERRLPDDIRIERFDRALTALDRIREARPDRAALFAETQRVALRGAADDHYFARNFAESFSLFERLLVSWPNAPQEVPRRWMLSLGLALAETRPPIQLDRAQAAAFAARVRAIAERASIPIGTLVEGLVVDAAGLEIEAGQSFSRGLGRPWQLPPAESRGRAIEELRTSAVERLRQEYESTRTRERGGAWSVAFENTWKSRRTAHFQVSARNDLVAQRVAAAAEEHLAEILREFGFADDAARGISCELHVHESLDALRAVTGSNGGARAVTRTKVQAGRVLSQRIDLFQGDVWLLGSTLPHELVHVVLVAAAPDVVLPRAMDEGIALCMEPFARRLQFLRTLALNGEPPSDLLSVSETPADEIAFYAECLPLAEVFWSRWSAGTSADMPGFIRAWKDGPGDETWTRLGWKSAQEWKDRWLERRRILAGTPRSPLVLSAGASSR